MNISNGGRAVQMNISPLIARHGQGVDEARGCGPRALAVGVCHRCVAWSDRVQISSDDARYWAAVRYRVSDAAISALNLCDRPGAERSRLANDLQASVLIHQHFISGCQISHLPL